MQDIKKKITYIKESVSRTEDYVRDILFLLEKNILEIRDEDDYKVINMKFDEIQQILWSLEEILWKDSFNFPKKLYKIANNFDRVDDPHTRKLLAEKIKKGIL